MTRVHEGDSGLVFDSHPQDFETASYCMDSGLAPSGACRAAGRVATGRFWKGQTPTELCPHQGFKTYDYGKTTGIEVEEEEEESRRSKSRRTSRPIRRLIRKPTAGNADRPGGRRYEFGRHDRSGAAARTRAAQPIPMVRPTRAGQPTPAVRLTRGGTTDPDTSTEPETPPPDDPEA